MRSGLGWSTRAGTESVIETIPARSHPLVQEPQLGRRLGAGSLDQLVAVALKCSKRLGLAPRGRQRPDDEAPGAIPNGVLDDVWFEHGESVVGSAVGDQRLAEILDRGGPDRPQPGRLADSPGLVGEFLEGVAHPSLERTGDRHDIALGRLELSARHTRINDGIQSVPANSGLQRLLSDESAQAGHRGPQRTAGDLEHPAQPLRPHGGRRVDCEHTEETALRCAGKLDPLASRPEQLHRAQHPDRGLTVWHHQSLAHAVMRR